MKVTGAMSRLPATRPQRFAGFCAATARRLAWPAGLLLLYVALAVASTWPVARYPRSLAPGGATGVATVPLFNAWTIWWNADRCAQGFSDYWNAPIFWPHHGTFAFSEPQPATLVVAPVLWLTQSRLLAYNVYLLGSLAANGLFAVWFLRTAGVGRGLSIPGGAAVVLLPLVHEQLDVAQLVPLWPVLWTLIGIVRLSRSPSVPAGILAGAGLGLTFWTSIHHALFFSLLLVLSAPLLPIAWTRGQTLSAAAAGLGVAAALSLPLVLPLHGILSDYSFERSERIVDRLSASPDEYTTAPGSGLLPGSLRSTPGGRRRLPGWLNCCGALLALAVTLRSSHRRTVWYLGAIAAAAVLLSLGTNLRIAGWQPWWTLSELIPGIAQVRNVYRFAYFFQLMVVLLAFLGLAELRRRVRCSPRAGPWSSVVVWTAAVLMVAEVAPPRGPVVGAPTVEHNRAWIGWVRDNLTPGKAVLHLPWVPGHRVADFDYTVRMMFLGTWHRRPLINGYSGFFPKSHFELQRLLQQEFPTAESLRRLEREGVELIVVLRSDFPESQMLRRTEGGPGLELMLRGDHGHDVYRLRPVTTARAIRTIAGDPADATVPADSGRVD